MASIKISELNETTELESNDLFAVVDTVADETKKMSYGSLKTQLIGDNFAILTGSVANTELTLGGKQVDYPTGFSQSNCVVIAAMKKNHIATGIWNSYYSTYNSTDDKNEVGIMVQMFSNKMKLVTPTDYTNERTESSESNGYDYRVILMKIS